MSGWAARLAPVLAVLAAVGCSTGEPGPAPSEQQSAAPEAPPLGPRPAVLRLDKVDPCGLLNVAQRDQFKLSAGLPSEDDDGTGNRVCIWHTDTLTAGRGLLARLEFAHGAEWFRDSANGAEIVQVAGFAAVQTSSYLADPAAQCAVAVDVAPGQSLLVQYEDRETPGMTHQAACQLARQLAEPMIGNLRTLAR